MRTLLTLSSATRAPRHPAPAWGAVLGFMVALAGGFAGQGAELNRGVLGVGFSSSGFATVNRNDAEAGFLAILKSAGLKRNYVLEPRLKVFDDASAYEAAIKNGTVMLAIIDSWSYLKMDLRAHAKPFFVSSLNGNIARRYLILTRRESALKTMVDLRGKSLIEFESSNASLGRPWLETYLLEHHRETPESFFGGIEMGGKATSVVLPVFFGGKDACLVDEPGFEVMKELNPRVGQALQVVAISEPLVNGVVCLRDSGWSSEEGKAELIRALGEMHLEPAGQQVLTLFKSGQLVPFQEKHLDTVRKLRATHDRLQGQSR